MASDEHKNTEYTPILSEQTLSFLQAWKPLYLQIAVFLFSIYYELLAFAAFYVGIYRFSLTPATGLIRHEVTGVLHFINCSAWGWMGFGVIMFVTGVLGKVAAKTSSRVLLGIVTVVSALVTAGLILTAVLIDVELVDRNDSIPYANLTSVNDTGPITNGFSRDLEVQRLIRTAGGLSASTCLGCLVTCALFIRVCARKHSGAEQFSYGNLVELDEPLG